MGSNSQITLHIKPSGNGWLCRSAVAVMHRVAGVHENAAGELQHGDGSSGSVPFLGREVCANYFPKSGMTAEDVVDNVKSRVAMWVKAKFDIKVYTVEEFKQLHIVVTFILTMEILSMYISTGVVYVTYPTEPIFNGLDTTWLHDIAALAWGAATTMHISTATQATFFSIVSDDLAIF
ncbi:hypothetical protein RHMOL_Rhmol05G0306100 [Rhododendron molle]|uniref:Uncharacterized protein n=1 Tax=Rhododendron molle TaxID=49168 RepID=A0ACC0NWE1_RHOML|nr:hypothetical protein RHMOL_Rhmol05G0306100 [Rhododendron molle]